LSGFIFHYHLGMVLISTIPRMVLVFTNLFYQLGAVDLFSTIPWGSDFFFHYGGQMLFYFPLWYFPFCFPLWGFPFCFPLTLFFRHVLHYGVTRHVLHYGVGSVVAVRVPFGAVHGMARPQSSKANEGIFKPLAGRYIFCSGITWLEFLRS
jgi:hypothetical protein